MGVFRKRSEESIFIILVRDKTTGELYEQTMRISSCAEKNMYMIQKTYKLMYPEEISYKSRNRGVLREPVNISQLENPNQQFLVRIEPSLRRLEESEAVYDINTRTWTETCDARNDMLYLFNDERILQTVYGFAEPGSATREQYIRYRLQRERILPGDNNIPYIGSIRVRKGEAYIGYTRQDIEIAEKRARAMQGKEELLKQYIPQRQRIINQQWEAMRTRVDGELYALTRPATTMKDSPKNTAPTSKSGTSTANTGAAKTKSKDEDNGVR